MSNSTWYMINAEAEATIYKSKPKLDSGLDKEPNPKIEHERS